MKLPGTRFGELMKETDGIADKPTIIRSLPPRRSRSKVPAMRHHGPRSGSARAGKNTAMVAKTEMGLPHGATCPPQQLAKDQAEITLPLVVTANATVGKHNGVSRRISVPENSAVFTQSAAMGGTLRIDAPVAAKADAKPAPKPAEPNAAPPKPLSRSEQLRQRAK